MMMTNTNDTGTAMTERDRMLKFTPAAAICAAGMGWDLPADLPEALEHYRELRALAPYSLKDTLDQTARDFYEVARVALDGLGWDEERAFRAAVSSIEARREAVEARSLGAELVAEAMAQCGGLPPLEVAQAAAVLCRALGLGREEAVREALKRVRQSQAPDVLKSGIAVSSRSGIQDAAPQILHENAPG